MFKFNAVPRPRDRFTTLPAADPPASCKRKRTASKMVYVSEEVHARLKELSDGRHETFSQTIDYLIESSASKPKQKQSGDYQAGLCLVETARLKDFFPYLYCPEHKQHMTARLSVRGGSYHIKAICPHNCEIELAGTSPYEPSSPRNRRFRRAECRTSWRWRSPS